MLDCEVECGDRSLAWFEILKAIFSCQGSDGKSDTTHKASCKANVFIIFLSLMLYSQYLSVGRMRFIPAKLGN